MACNFSLSMFLKQQSGMSPVSASILDWELPVYASSAGWMCVELQKGKFRKTIEKKYCLEDNFYSSRVQYFQTMRKIPFRKVQKNAVFWEEGIKFLEMVINNNKKASIPNRKLEIIYFKSKFIISLRILLWNTWAGEKDLGKSA